jgi:hypothetical protein
MNTYTWEYIKNHTKETKRLLGINYEQLELLLETGKIIHLKKIEKIEDSKTRIIKKGGGKPPKLSIEEEIVLTLVYLRHNITFQLLGLLFQVSESTANDIFKYWLKILEDALPASLIEQVKKSESQIEEQIDNLKEELTEHKLIVDSEEQTIYRPSDYETQKTFYSGKKKNHTFKNQVIVLPQGLDIVDVTVGLPGPTSDIKICRETLDKFDIEQKFIGDKAYLGENQIQTPKKKPKNGELTEDQKIENKELSASRIFVEHVIRLIKIFRIMQERFRLHKSQYKSVFLTVCGLVRLRIGALILELIKSADLDSTIEVLLTHSFGDNLIFEHIT